MRLYLLLACEGTTEELYFDAVRKTFGVRGEVTARGRDPLGVVDEAHRIRLRIQRVNPGPVEVWCVFDGVGPDITPALQAAAEYGFQVIVSTPCFEIWPLLHFRPSHRYIDCGEAAKRELRQYIPDYTESMPIYHEYLRDRETKAISNLGLLRTHHAGHESGDYANPSTNADALLLRLKNGT